MRRRGLGLLPPPPTAYDRPSIARCVFSDPWEIQHSQGFVDSNRR